MKIREKISRLVPPEIETYLSLQYFALLISFLRQTDNNQIFKIQSSPYILK